MTLRSLLQGLLFAASLFLATSKLHAQQPEPFLIEDGDTVVFFGDSITQGGGYIAYVDAYLRTRFPDKSFTILNAGISSETISGTSETDHNPRRPWAHERMTRDVVAHKPDVVFSCFGMNDGNYHPFEGERFKKYQAGIRLLQQRLANETDATLVINTPPPFDPYRRGAGDPNATEYGYKFPAVDYDQTLEAYSQWLLTLREEGQRVVDLHTALNAHLREKRKTNVSYFIAGDAVHPNDTGHWLMAYHILQGINAPETTSEATFNLTDKTASSTVENARYDGMSREVRLTWTMPRPWPIDSATQENVREEWATMHRYRLQIQGLPAGRYLVQTVEPESILTVSAQELADGVDVLPLVSDAILLTPLADIRQYRQKVDSAYRSRVRQQADADPVSIAQEARNEHAELNERIRATSQPVSIDIWIRPAEARIR